MLDLVKTHKELHNRREQAIKPLQERSERYAKAIEATQKWVGSPEQQWLDQATKKSG